MLRSFYTMYWENVCVHKIQKRKFSPLRYVTFENMWNIPILRVLTKMEFLAIEYIFLLTNLFHFERYNYLLIYISVCKQFRKRKKNIETLEIFWNLILATTSRTLKLSDSIDCYLSHWIQCGQSNPCCWSRRRYYDFSGQCKKCTLTHTSCMIQVA